MVDVRVPDEEVEPDSRAPALKYIVCRRDDLGAVDEPLDDVALDGRLDDVAIAVLQEELSAELSSLSAARRCMTGAVAEYQSR